MLEYTPYIKSVDGFPTILYINEGLIVPYDESSAVKSPDRSLESFIAWICGTSGKCKSKPIIDVDYKSSSSGGGSRKNKKTKRGRNARKLKKKTVMRSRKSKRTKKSKGFKRRTKK